MNWFDVILGGIVGLLTGYFGVTVIGIIFEFVENTIKKILRVIGVRVGVLLETFIRVILFFPIGYLLFYVPLFVALPFVSDRFFLYGGWYFGILIGAVAYTIKEKIKEEKQKRGRVKFWL